MKKTLLALSLIFILSGCESPKYDKVGGEVVGKNIYDGRYGVSYYIEISYPVGDGKFSISEVDVGKEDYNKYKTGDKVTTYVNEDGIGTFVKEK